jgi:hypothetical protein
MVNGMYGTFLPLHPHFPLYKFQTSNMSVQPKYAVVLPVLERTGTSGRPYIEIFFDEENVKGKD